VGVNFSPTDWVSLADYSTNWRELKFNEIKLKLISDYKNNGIEISDIVNAQNINSFETKNLTIV
jgi:hypothetical protein